MPYINSMRQIYLECGIECDRETPKTSGELTFLLTTIIKEYLNQTDKEPNFQTLNEIIGSLECTKLEFYRRMVAPYEDQKIKENGDVY